jgi:hypothetical protein
MANKKAKYDVKITVSSPSISLMVLGRLNIWCLMVYLGLSNKMCLTLSCILQEAHMGRWDGRQKIAVCEMGVANPQASHHSLVMVDKVTRSPWEYHWLHISQLLALCVVPVLLPFVQETLMEGSLKVQTEDTRHQGALSCGVPSCGISLLLISTWPGNHAKFILQSHLQSVW